MITKRNQSVIWSVIIYGIAVHLILLMSVFDIYFISPIEHGMKSYKSEGIPPAKRLVLIVGDGLRAESIYNAKHPDRMPFLNYTRLQRGSWGVSHTRVPTESRPGHVAILAGIYEDPSAITRGWQSNPVDFDTVINQSRNAWCWGSPDIIDMFNKDNLPHIRLESYDATMEDFSGKDSTILLDKWVFDRVRELFAYKRRPCGELCKGNNLFFLHLLGLDTAGHSYKPNSERHTSNIQYVDEQIEAVEELFERFFNDHSTAYVFTADHGMTDWGSHGDGSVHETETPIIAWGAGIPKNNLRNDINQADLAPLLAALIGINIPVNSVGITPVNYLNVNSKQLALIMLSNAKQLTEQYNIKRRKTKENTIFLFHKPYPKLSVNEIETLFTELNNLIDSEEYEEAISKSMAVMELALEGIKYYQTYYQRFLLVCITIGFLGWLVSLCTTIIASKDLRFIDKSLKCGIQTSVFLSIVTITSLLIYYQSLPLLYYIYCNFPTLSLWIVGRKMNELSFAYYSVIKNGFLRIFSFAIGYLIATEVLVLAFFERESLSLLMVVLSVWIYFVDCSQHQIVEKIKWFVLCLCLGLFPLLPVMKTTFNATKFTLAMCLWVAISSYFLKRIWNLIKTSPNRYVIKTQLIMFALSVVNVYYVNFTIETQQGLQTLSQYYSWLSLGSSILLPFFSSRNLLVKLTSITFAFAPLYLLMSVNYDGVFLGCFILFLDLWIVVEFKLSNNYFYKPLTLVTFNNLRTRNKITHQEDFRRGFFFLLFVYMAFFGTGNVASINTFDPMWVRCFLTVFSPFTMTALILTKLLIPFLFVSCIFHAIHKVVGGKVTDVFAVVLLLCDIMVLNFFYMIKNEGSWLEIGLSLSHFIIVEVTTIFLLLLHALARILTNTDLKVHLKPSFYKQSVM